MPSLSTSASAGISRFLEHPELYTLAMIGFLVSVMTGIEVSIFHLHHLKQAWQINEIRHKKPRRRKRKVKPPTPMPAD